MIDSGATSHICYDRSYFVEIQPAVNTYIILPTKSRFLVEYTGSVKLSSDVFFTEVLYVPSFTYNLISISALMRDTCYLLLY